MYILKYNDTKPDLCCCWMRMACVPGVELEPQLLASVKFQ